MPDQPRRYPQPSPGPAAVGLASEEFLFHLYRGSELLSENHVHEAKEEIETALRLQPADPKTQDLMAAVYFRLGLYPRAIDLYADIAASFPDDVTPRLNLALCLLKTGQYDKARDHLEEIIRLSPRHERAWAYLGLVFERLRDYDKARVAFERAGQKGMVRRMLDQIAAASATPPPVESRATDPRNEMRRAAEEAFYELDAGDVSFSVDPPASNSKPTGAWQTTEPGHQSQLPRPPRVARSMMRSDAPSALPQPGQYASILPTQTVAAASSKLLFVFPDGQRVVQLSSGAVLVSVAESFAVRLDLVRVLESHVGAVVTTPVQRRTRGKTTGSSLGSGSRPISLLSGATRLLLMPDSGRRLLPLELDGDFLYVREDLLAGFDQCLGYENGRLPVGEGEAVPMVHVQGKGFVVIDSPQGLGTLEVTTSASVFVRRESVIGWTGRLVSRSLAASDAPCNIRGCVAFAGEGFVWIDTSTGPTIG